MKKIVLSFLFALTLVVVAMPAYGQKNAADWQKEIARLEQQKKESGIKVNAAREASTKAKTSEEEKKRKEDYDKAVEEFNDIAKQLKNAKDKLTEAQKNEGISASQGTDENTSSQVQAEEVKSRVEEINDMPDEVPAIPKEDVDTTDATINNATSSDSTSTSGNWWKYLLAVLGISGLCSGAVFYILNKKIEDLKSMLKGENLAAQRMLNQRLDNLAVKTDRIETSVGSVRQDIRNRDRIVANEPQRPATSYGPATVQPPQPKRPTEFFLSMPSIDGSWNDVSTVNKPGQCLYVLNSPDGINGTFRVINEPVAVQSILMAVGKYLSPVCRVTNTATQVSGIVTDEPGVAVFENGTWRMTKKAVVHYV